MERLCEKTIKENEKRIENEMSRTRIILQLEPNRGMGQLSKEIMLKNNYINTVILSRIL